jgi:endonuclease/exonuclease/phosphatase family metal-dependent hydrolase
MNERKTVTAALCAVLCLLLAVLACGLSDAAAPLKVMTFNIHHGEGTDNRFDLPGIAAIIRESGADIVGLQEVDQRTTRSGRVDQLNVIAEHLGFYYAFGPHFPYMGGNYGLGVLSRYPIVTYRVYPLPTAPGVEAKSLLQATVDINGTLIDVFVIHFEVRNEAVRQAQADEASAIAARSQLPAVFMGDFNALPNSSFLHPLRYWMLDTYVSARFLAQAALMEKDPPEESMYAAGGATWPAEAPVNRADMIWATAHWKPAQGHPVRTMASERSDHMAVVATLELLPEPLPAAQLPTTWAAATQGVVLIPPAAATWLNSQGSDAAQVSAVLQTWMKEAGLTSSVATSAKDIPSGSLVVLPGGRYLSKHDAAALHAHVETGGALLVWGDAAMEASALPDCQAKDATEYEYGLLNSLLGIEYVGWSIGYPTRARLHVPQELATTLGLPATTRFWKMAGPVVRVLPGAEVLGAWYNLRGDQPAHPETVNAGLVQNGRTIYLGFDALNLSDADNPDAKNLVIRILRYLAAAKEEVAVD